MSGAITGRRVGWGTAVLLCVGLLAGRGSMAQDLPDLEEIDLGIEDLGSIDAEETSPTGEPKVLLDDFLTGDDEAARAQREVEAYEKERAFVTALVFPETPSPSERAIYFRNQMEALDILQKYAHERRVQEFVWTNGVMLYFHLNPEFIPRCIDIFMQQGTNAFPRLIEALFNAPIYGTRNRMASILSRYKPLDPDRVEDVLVKAFRTDRDENVRGPICKLLLGKNYLRPITDRVWKALVEALYEDDNTLTKYLVAWYRCGKMDVAIKCRLDHLPLILDLLENGKGWENRWFALEILYYYRWSEIEKDRMEREALPHVIRAALEDPNWRVRFRALDVLLQFDDPAANEAVIRMLREDSEADIRSYAANVLGIVKESRAASAMRDALGDADPFVRYYSALGLERLGDVQSASALEAYPLDGEPEPWVADAVRKALRALRGGKGS